MQFYFVPMIFELFVLWPLLRPLLCRRKVTNRKERSLNIAACPYARRRGRGSAISATEKASGASPPSPRSPRLPAHAYVTVLLFLKPTS